MDGASVGTRDDIESAQAGVTDEGSMEVHADDMNSPPPSSGNHGNQTQELEGLDLCGPRIHIILADHSKLPNIARDVLSNELSLAKHTMAA